MKSRIKRSSWLQDIRRYEYAVGIIRVSVIFGIILYLFYESAVPALYLFSVWMMFFKEWIDDMTVKKEQEFRLQFRDAIQAMSAALKTGYSIENAIKEVKYDILPMYGEHARIIKEFSIIEHQLDMNRNVKYAMEDFSRRVMQEDVKEFVNVFQASQKSGGDSISIIRNAVHVISGKIETQKEIQVLLASKKLEFDIMCVVPFVIVLYMKLTFGEFLEVLYAGVEGRIIMTILLGVYLLAYRTGRKLVRIEV